MVIIVENSVETMVEQWLDERLPGSQIVGEVTNEGKRVSHVNSSIYFDHY